MLNNYKNIIYVFYEKNNENWKKENDYEEEEEIEEK